MIMLPLHSQNTAAVKIITEQALPIKYITIGDVFVKQVNIKIAKFLFIL